MPLIIFSFILLTFTSVAFPSVECPPLPLEILLSCENKSLTQSALQLKSHKGLYRLDESKSEWDRKEKILKCVYSSVSKDGYSPWSSTYVYEDVVYSDLSSKSVLRDLVRGLPLSLLPQRDIQPVSHPFFEIHYRVQNKELVHETYIFTTGLEYIVSRHQISSATENDELLTAVQKNFSRAEPEESDYLVTGSNCTFNAKEVIPSDIAESDSK